MRLFCGWLRDEADEQALGADPLVDLAYCKHVPRYRGADDATNAER